AVDQRRFPAAKKLHSHHIHSRRVRNAAVVPDVALAIHRRHLEPGIVGTETGCPDDGADRTAGEIESERWRILHARWRKTARSFDLIVESVFTRPGVDGVEQ